MERTSTFFFFCCFTLGPPCGSLKEFGGCINAQFPNTHDFNCVDPLMITLPFKVDRDNERDVGE
jgi:hypothetical protein